MVQPASKRLVTEATGATVFVGKGKGRPRSNSRGSAFGAVVSSVEGSNDYIAFSGTVDTIDGDLITAYRASTGHDVAAGSNYGILRVRRSTDLGETWGAPVTVVDRQAQTEDARDVSLYRVPDTRRIYMSYFVLNGATGLRLSYSDDDGATWSAPASVTTSLDAAGTGIRLCADGKWRWPIYRKVGSFYKAMVLTATDPLGAWTNGADVYAPAAANATEWDFAEISATNWVAMIRSSDFTNVVVSQSTDSGATWSAPVQIPIRGGQAYDGWPVLRKFRDGRVVAFARRSAGLGVLQLLDTAAPLTVANWLEPVVGAASATVLDSGSGGNWAGKFDPVLMGDNWVGTYTAETASQTAAEVRVGRISEGAFHAGRSFVATAEKIPDASAVGSQALTTPDQVVIRTRGGWFRVAYKVRSYQISGTVSNYQIDVQIDGTLNGATTPLYTTIGGSSRGTTSGYYDMAEDLVYLGPGKHTLQLMYRQDTTTVGRTFDGRLLTVTPA